QLARRARIAPGRQMDAVGVACLRQRCIAVQRQRRAVAPRRRQQFLHKRELLVLGKLLLAHADPTAAGGERRGHHIGQRQPRLPAIRDEQQRRGGGPPAHLHPPPPPPPPPAPPTPPLPFLPPPTQNPPIPP